MWPFIQNSLRFRIPLYYRDLDVFFDVFIPGKGFTYEFEYTPHLTRWLMGVHYLMFDFWLFSVEFYLDMTPGAKFEY